MTNYQFLSGGPQWVAANGQVSDWNDDWTIPGQIPFAAPAENQSFHPQPHGPPPVHRQTVQVNPLHMYHACNLQSQWPSVGGQNSLDPQLSDSSISSPIDFGLAQPLHLPSTQQEPAPTIDSSNNMIPYYDDAPFHHQSNHVQYKHDNSGSQYPLPPQYNSVPSNNSSPYMGHGGQDDASDLAQQAMISQMYTEDYHSRASTPLGQATFHLPKRSETPFDDNSSETAYAHLLFKCLEAAPNNKMGLRDIYNWMYDNCPRVRDVNNKGWQNSVRHNLSMNKGFEKVPSPCGSTSKKGTMWRLSQDALMRGHVLSTTQYRKKTKKVNPRSRAFPAAPQRASAGSKGGLASKRAQEKRRQEAAAYRAPTSAPSYLHDSLSRYSSPALTNGSFSPVSVTSPYEPILMGPCGSHSPQIYQHSRSATPDGPAYMDLTNLKTGPTSDPSFMTGFDQLAQFNKTHGYATADDQSELLDNINVNTAQVIDTEAERQDFDLFFGGGHAANSPQYTNFPDHV